jgi:NAD(P)-dependent dehydrogenase (short-subunit alcohol dehydrogenase family)
MAAMPTLLVLGARNLGGAIAEHFAARDWNVAAVARSDETLAQLGDRVPGALALQADASSVDQLADACAATRAKFGAVDLIVNAVSPGMRSQGQFGGGPLIDSTPDDFEHYATQVVRQSYAFLSAGARALREEGGGTLIQITGGSSRRALPGKGPWAAGAFGSRALTQAAALELRDVGIHAALLIVDATIRSPKTAAWTGDAPEDGLAEQEDVAAAVDYLWSQAPSAWTHELVLTPRGDRWTP